MKNYLTKTEVDARFDEAIENVPLHISKGDKQDILSFLHSISQERLLAMEDKLKLIKKYYKEKTFGKNQSLTTELHFEIVDETVN